MKNLYLRNAKNNKNDEFYTQLKDIEAEILPYPEIKKQFENKVVYMNCDSNESNFIRFFIEHFSELHLQKIIATSLSNSGECSDKLEWDGINKPIISKLKNDGDFRSDECINLLKEADIIVTNPPFSLFREYISLLIEYNKKFLIIGNQNAITYKEVFPLIQENKVWLGQSIHSGDREFRIPDDYPLNTKNSRIDEDGNKFVRVTGVRWFTNLETNERHKLLQLNNTYAGNEDYYLRFDNYDGINVNKTVEIPKDFDGIMGVPITFLDKYCPEQFKILGITKRTNDPYRTKVYSKLEYANANDLNARACVMQNGKLKVLYARILIKNKMF